MTRKHTDSDARAIAKRLQPDFVPTTPYPGSARKPWEGRHLVCGRTISPNLNNMQSGQGCCKACAGKDSRVSREKLAFIVAEKGGKVDLSEYTSCHKKLPITCAEGHTWEVAPADITSNGHWCPVCAGQDFETVKNKFFLHVRDRGGYANPDDYINSVTKLPITCVNGHVWCTTPDSVTNGGHWCPTCAGSNYDRLYVVQRLVGRRWWLKIGIAYGENRVNTHINRGWVLLYQWRGDYKVVRDIETAIKTLGKALSWNHLSRERMPDGYTETFEKIHLPEIRELIKGMGLTKVLL